MRRFRPSFEQFEPRLALAGLVTTSLRGDVLTITGDGASNGIEVRQEAGGHLSITSAHRGDVLAGFPEIEIPADVLTTNVRGLDGVVGTSALILEHVREVRIRLGDGNDVLFIGRIPGGDFPVTTFGTLDVDLGNGNNTATAVQMQVSSEASFRAGTGNDQFGLIRSVVLGDLSITSGSGRDLVGMYQASGTLGDLSIDTGRGSDVVSMSDAIEVGGDLSVVTGRDADFVQIGLAFVVHGSLRVDTGSGNDQIGTAGDVQVLGVATFLGGSDGDAIRLAGTLYADGGMQIDTGSGDDLLWTIATIRTPVDIVAAFGTGADRVETVEGADLIPTQDLVIRKDAGSFTMTLDLLGGAGIGRDLVIRSAARTSTVLLRNVLVQRDLLMTTGSGADDVTVAQVIVRRNVAIATAAGRDSIAITTTRVEGETRIDSGTDADTVDLRHTIARAGLFASLGQGDDSLSLYNVELTAIAGAVSLNGGRRGRDSLRLDYLHVNQAPSRTDFESVTLGPNAA